MTNHTVPRTHEVNFDGIVGPTHNYAGLSHGNVASQAHRGQPSNPRRAALQGIAKMRLMLSLGVRQAVLPPQHRPSVRTLRRLGFNGGDAQVLQSARREDPVLLASCCAASAMWTANAATVSPSADCADGRVHLTVANLLSQSHRAIEPADTLAVLRQVFADETRFAVHEPLPAASHLADEGAANHSRLCGEHGSRGVELFAYGRHGLAPGEAGSARFPARQTLEASCAVARLHGLDPRRVVFARQEPRAIDAGVFHNDVICVGHQNLLLYHEDAFADGDGPVIDAIDGAMATAGGPPIVPLRVARDEVSFDDAVRSYLFNSQLVTDRDGRAVLVAPAECRETASTARCIERLAAEGPIAGAHFVDLRQSMQNGGGPACLRLRVTLTDGELACVHPGVLATPALLDALSDWVNRHYRDRLAPEDLPDPRLLDESRAALSELALLLGLRLNVD